MASDAALSEVTAGPGLVKAVRDAGTALACERCWLYARDPARRVGIALVRWLSRPAVPDVPEDLLAWSPEPPDLAERDPLFARALAGAPADPVADARTAPVDRSLEGALGHRAFVHVNLHVGGVLWGTLQPGMTSRPRAWTVEEEAALLALRAPLAHALASLVAAHGTRLASARVVGGA